MHSYSPDMPPIDLAVRGEDGEFYERELAQRKLLSFPPYSRLLRLVFRSPVPGEAEKAAAGAAEIITRENAPGEFELLGPSQCPLEMIAGNWRWQIIMRGKKMPPLQRAASAFIRNYAPSGHVYIEADVDPISLL